PILHCPYRGQRLASAPDQMMKKLNFSIIAIALLCGIFCSFVAGAETFRVATYNVENYLDQPAPGRPDVKSREAKAKIRESIRVMNPDVLALEEMASTNALLE